MTDVARIPADDETDVGSYFVANYPPFSVWTADAVDRDAMPALDAPPAAGVPLGLYLHIPFCRKRCHFCYFRVYTDKNARQCSSTSTCSRANGRISAGARPRRPADGLRVLRRRHAVVPFDAAARGTRAAADGRLADFDIDQMTQCKTETSPHKGKAWGHQQAAPGQPGSSMGR